MGYEGFPMAISKEHARMLENTGTPPPWSIWGPYVSERAWGTVREDYSPDGNAWDYLPHNIARSKAYRWGEDGLAGICDRYQSLVFALALWNGQDPILKERAFGLNMREGNHGEDVKEYYFYLDNTPMHSYMHYLYKYPQSEFPYQDLVAENKSRNGSGPEYELMDTGVFSANRYFDVEVEYAKASPTDICILISATNHASKSAPLHILPHLWFRNTWAWGEHRKSEPEIKLLRNPTDSSYKTLLADCTNLDPISSLLFHYKLPNQYLFAEGDCVPLFTNNETNLLKIYGASNPTATRYTKDAFHRHLIAGEQCINPENKGTKACFNYKLDIAAGETVQIKLRLTSENLSRPFVDFDSVIAIRKAEADDFYQSIYPKKASKQERLIQRQAFANLLWSKQFYLFNVRKWLKGDNDTLPPPISRNTIRNQHWKHLNSKRILIMPDKWEYPWFAAWDLAFSCVPMALIDPTYAKEQLWLMLFEQFQHPNGQIPAYEWDFSDLNPPVHAWAVWRVFNMEKKLHNNADLQFLERCFHKLLLNFTWWVNKVDSQGNNIFEGGFLGLDNISVVDRSEALAEGETLEQSDATGWMAMFCLNMMRIALELAKTNPTYENLAIKFLEHYIYIGAAMKNMGQRNYQLWDEQDAFFYDVLRYPDNSYDKFRVRSLVGLIPMFAVERLDADWIKPFPSFRANLNWFLQNRNQFSQFCCHKISDNGKSNYLLSIPNQQQIRCILFRIFDNNEFLSQFGMRSMSKTHQHNPFKHGNAEVRYEPAEAESKLKGGNSNWRGPIWFPVGFLMIESLRKLYKALGPEFTIDLVIDEKPRNMNLMELAQELANRMIRLFELDKHGCRPIYGDEKCFQNKPDWKNLILFHEYFHAENGKGLGASHQTWTTLIAVLLDEWRY